MKTRAELIELLEKLCRYAVDRAGFPDGDTAREKIKDLINKHPDFVGHPSVIALAKTDLKFVLPEPTIFSRFDDSEITTEEFINFKNAGGNIHGSWEGADFAEALERMMNDYRDRMQRLERVAFVFGREDIAPEDIEIDGGIRYWQDRWEVQDED